VDEPDGLTSLEVYDSADSWHGAAPDRGMWRQLRAQLQKQAKGQRTQLRAHLLQPVIGGSLYSLRNLGERLGMLYHSYHEAYAAARRRHSPQLILMRTNGIDDLPQAERSNWFPLR